MEENHIVPVLESERLVLCPLTLDDLPALFKWAGDERVNRYMLYPLYKSEEDGREWISSLYKDDKKDFGFVLKATGELIGSGGIYPTDEPGVWSIGYNLRRDHWGQGLVPEAMQRIVSWARESLGLKVLEGSFAVGNDASRRVMEKLGMTFYKDSEFTKLDGSETFKAKTYRRVLTTGSETGRCI